MKRLDLYKLLIKWKRILHLDMWDIKITYDKDLDAQGEVEIESENCTALIKIKDPDNWKNDYFELDIEQVLVHELLHIKFNMLESEDEIIYTLYHQQINDISKILCNMNSSKTPKLKCYDQKENPVIICKCLNKDDGIDAIFNILDKVQSDGSLYSLTPKAEDTKLFKKDNTGIIHRMILENKLKLLFNSSNEFNIFKRLNPNAICDYYSEVANDNSYKNSIIAYYTIYQYYYE